MQQGLTITIVDVDPDYLGIEIRASNDRFAGSTRIYAGLSQLSEFADRIAGFPTNPKDDRRYEFGTPDPGFAGGYCSFHLQCVDSSGHARLHVAMEDDYRLHELATAKLAFPVLAADIDRFTIRLRDIEKEQFGEANLPMAFQ
jgi:hypothetical protein